MLSEKGKYAAATQNRRTVWEKVVWPLILEINELTFSVKQYQKKRDKKLELQKQTNSKSSSFFTASY